MPRPCDTYATALSSTGAAPAASLHGSKTALLHPRAAHKTRVMDIDRDRALIHHRRTILDIGGNDAAIRRRVQSGRLACVFPGHYVDAREWESRWPEERHRLRVLASAYRIPGLVYSHEPAAALWGLPLVGAWPERVSTTGERTAGGRSTPNVRRHSTDASRVEVVEHADLLVTSPRQTVLDLARTRAFVDGVTAADAALHRRRGRPLLLQDELAEALEQVAGRPGCRRARRVVGFASPLADSAAESVSRVQFHVLGFPAPELQHAMRIDGRHYEADFWWPEYRHWAECDGDVKYTDAARRGDRSPEEVLLDEKDREDAIRRHVAAFSRWRAQQAFRPRELYRILRDAGLPAVGTRRLPS